MSSEQATNAIALIPARAGSKRIPGKNRKQFCGEPLIAYSIRAALQTQLFRRVLVSTDCDEITAIATTLGAEVPFLRPQTLADDFATIGDVVQHTLEHLAAHQQTPEFLCCLFATAPMIAVADIRQGLRQLQDQPDFNQALAVTSFSFPIQRALHWDSTHGLTMVQPEHRTTRSQDLPPRYHDAGQFFWTRVTGRVAHPKSGALPVFVERFRVQDIDTPEDWTTAEMQYRAWQLVQKTREYAA